MRDSDSKEPIFGETRLLKYADSLYLAGTGFAAFGLWSVAKTLFYYWWNYANSASNDYTIVGGILVTIFLIIDLVLRLYVCKSAHLESHALFDSSDSRRPRVLYLVLAGISVLEVFLTLPMVIDDFFSAKIDIFDASTTWIIELTHTYIVLQLIVSAIQIWRYRKWQES